MELCSLPVIYLGQTMVEVMKIMVTSFKRSHAGTAILNAPDPASGLGAWDLLKEISMIFITSIIVWPQDKQQGGKTAPPINRKLG